MQFCVYWQTIYILLCCYQRDEYQYLQYKKKSNKNYISISGGEPQQDCCSRNTTFNIKHNTLQSKVHKHKLSIQIFYTSNQNISYTYTINRKQETSSVKFIHLNQIFWYKRKEHMYTEKDINTNRQRYMYIVKQEKDSKNIQKYTTEIIFMCIYFVFTLLIIVGKLFTTCVPSRQDPVYRLYMIMLLITS